MRRALLICLALVESACPSASGPSNGDPDCGKLSAFEADPDYQACDRTGLASRTSGGIWQIDNQLDALSTNAGPPGPGAMNLDPDADGGLLLGQPITERIEDAQTFYIAATSTSGGVETRLAYAGCHLDAPDQLQGLYSICVGGVRVRSGPFEAIRLARHAGEGESAGIALLSESQLSGSPADVVVGATRAYVPRFEGGLSVLDVGTPAAPTLQSELDGADAGAWVSAATKGNALYVATQLDGVLVYDTTDATNLVAQTPLSTVSSSAVGVRVFGDVLYATDWNGGQVRRYTLGSPLTPTLQVTYTPVGANPASNRSPDQLFELDGRLYIAAHALGLSVLDVSAPTVPHTLGAYSYPDASSRSVVVGTFGLRKVAFEAGGDWGGHVRILDVTNPQAIALLSEYSLRSEVAVRGLVLRGTRLYVAHLQDGLRVLDVAVPESPAQIAYFNSWREQDPGRGQSFYEGATGVSVPGDGYVYVSESSRGLLVFAEPAL